MRFASKAALDAWRGDTVDHAAWDWIGELAVDPLDPVGRDAPRAAKGPRSAT